MGRVMRYGWGSYIAHVAVRKVVFVIVGLVLVALLAAVGVKAESYTFGAGGGDATLGSVTTGTDGVISVSITVTVNPGAFHLVIGCAGGGAGAHGIAGGQESSDMGGTGVMGYSASCGSGVLATAYVVSHGNTVGWSGGSVTSSYVAPTPTPTATPTLTPTPEPSASPTPEPSASPTASPDPMCSPYCVVALSDADRDRLDLLTFSVVTASAVALFALGVVAIGSVMGRR